MMNNNSIFNNPQRYAATPEEIVNRSMPAEAAFAVQEGEKLFHTFMPYDNTSFEDISECMDAVDSAIIEEIGRSKYLTSLQIFEFIGMRGLSVKRPRLRKRILKLMKYRMIQENEIKTEDAVNGIKYYELDVKGYQFVRERGVEFHMGNRYVSFTRKMELGITETSSDVKRILVGNQIVIGMLLNHAKIQRFGIMETFCVEREKRVQDKCILRTAANVKIDEDSVLAYEVVRDTPEGYTKLADKVERYYALLDNREYLIQNHHGDTSFPQLVICGESIEHNSKIADFLKSKGLWRNEDPILFTEDLLNIKDSLKSLYEIREDGLCWYRVPAREARYFDERSA